MYSILYYNMISDLRLKTEWKSKPGVLYNCVEEAINHLCLDSVFLLERKLRGTFGLSSSIWRLWTI